MVKVVCHNREWLVRISIASMITYQNKQIAKPSEDYLIYEFCNHRQCISVQFLLPLIWWRNWLLTFVYFIPNDWFDWTDKI
jgi:hypothetical protein